MSNNAERKKKNYNYEFAQRSSMVGRTFNADVQFGFVLFSHLATSQVTFVIFIILVVRFNSFQHFV